MELYEDEQDRYEQANCDKLEEEGAFELKRVEGSGSCCLNQ